MRHSPLLRRKHVARQPVTLQWKALLKQFKKRDKNAHKGDFGHVLVIGGDTGYAGAVRMAAEAALRVGAGLVSVITRPAHITAINKARPEIMCHPTSHLSRCLKKATVIVLGPGLGQSAWSKKIFQQVIRAPQPKIVDADALNLLSKKPFAQNNWILTPHVGEAARLLKCTTKKINADRVCAAQSLQQKFHGVIILKGAGTLICDEKNKNYICRVGNPGMASGGMGDVLSGVIGGLLAQHFSLFSAAATGVMLHARAGDMAARARGERGLLALDLMNYLQKNVNR